MTQTQNIANADLDRHEKYESKRQVKRASFNIETERDLLDYAHSLPDFSNWVKDKLRQDMQKQTKPD